MTTIHRDLSNCYEPVQMLLHKRTGRIVCPKCLKKVRRVKIPSGSYVLYCKKCKLFFPNITDEEIEKELSDNQNKTQEVEE